MTQELTGWFLPLIKDISIYDLSKRISARKFNLFLTVK
jgi:hypothetical protein